jgi:D-alanyl-D-alanine carboxypeptidase (penicillin-binding protein 5/6)
MSYGSTKQTIAWFFLFACASALLGSAALAAEIGIDARAGVLLDAQAGRILWQRQPDLALAPASTTKILTALLVLEKNEIDDLVTVDAEATRIVGGSARLRKGERLTVAQLLYAMMLGSANDAAMALARHAAGSVPQFVILMNERARSLGALRSSFRTPTGLPQKGHLTTARDLAVITRAALARSDFRTLVAARSYRWHSAAWEGELKNSNRLLEIYPGAIGVKTGQTREAGFCLVAAAARGEKSLIAVLLKSSEQAVWRDARALLDYGFRPSER